MIDDGVTKVLDKSEKADSKAKALAGTAAGVAMGVSGFLGLFPHFKHWLLIVAGPIVLILIIIGGLKIRRRQKEDLRQWLAAHPTPALDPLSPTAPGSGATSRVQDRA